MVSSVVEQHVPMKLHLVLYVVVAVALSGTPCDGLIASAKPPNKVMPPVNLHAGALVASRHHQEQSIPNNIFIYGNTVPTATPAISDPANPQLLINKDIEQANPDTAIWFFNYSEAEKSVLAISDALENAGIVNGSADAYRSLRPHAYKSDLWRYMILWQFGGIYLDAKVMLTAPLSTWVDLERDSMALCYDADYESDDKKNKEKMYWSAMVAARARAPEIAAIIKHIVRNVKHKFYGTKGEFHGDLEITGPGALTAALRDGGFEPRSSCSMHHIYDGLAHQLRREGYTDVYDGRWFDAFVLEDKGEKTRIAQTDYRIHKAMQECKMCESYTRLYKNHQVYCDEPGPPCFNGNGPFQGARSLRQDPFRHA